MDKQRKLIISSRKNNNLTRNTSLVSTDNSKPNNFVIFWMAF